MTLYRAREAARAKINLSLDVLDRLPDGYHELRSLMANIGLADQLFLSLEVADQGGKGGWNIRSDSQELPLGSGNLCHKAGRLFFQKLDKAPESVQLDIHIEKNIPMEAGLGGGSADAAAVLRFLWSAWQGGLWRELGLEKDRLNLEDLKAMALACGADVPFCLVGGVRLAKGIGQVLSADLKAPAWPLLLVKPSLAVSTAQAFARLDRLREGLTEVKSSGKILEADQWQTLLEGKPQALAPFIRNDFLDHICGKNDGIVRAIGRLKETSAFAVSMSGTGPSCFALFRDEEEARRAFQSVSADLKDMRVYLSQISPRPEIRQA